jgi:D-alanyl-D-alanine carboxypeptidase (penicillin-binding protein 5/6)
VFVVRRLLAAVVVAAVLFGGFALVQGLRGAPSLVLRQRTSSLTTTGAVALPWPRVGEAALAVPGVGTVGTHGGDAPLPIASITKVMTALVVLQDHPLAPGESGPTLTVTPADVATYQNDVATQQSVLAVAAGEQLTELQALEGLLIPSANNVADLLAQWDAGSIPAFVALMNRRAAALGLHHTHYVSPTGLEPGSVSTPEDLIRLGETAMANPVFASIVAMPEATLPVAGTVINYDYDLTHHGFVGIKTGSDSAAGGCFLFEADVPVDGRTVPVVGAVLGEQTAPIIQTALDDATKLVLALRSQLVERQIVAVGQHVATLRAPWGPSTAVVTDGSLSVVSWPGLGLSDAVHVSVAGPQLRRGQRVGTMDVVLNGVVHRIPLVAAHAVPGPSFGWKLGNL